MTVSPSRRPIKGPMAYLLALGVTCAQAQGVRTHTLEEALGLLEKQGAPWQIIEAEREEAEAQGAEGLSLRNPEVSYSREDLKDGGANSREWTVGLRKDFAMPGVYLNRRAAHGHRREALKQEYVRKREEVRGALRQTFLEAALKREQTKTLASLTGLVDAMVRAGKARYEEQSITSFEMFRLSSAQSRVRELMARTENEFNTLTRRLATWLYPEGGVSEVEPSEQAGSRSAVLDSAGLVRALEAQSPDLKALESRVREAEAAQRGSRHSLFPEVSLMGGWKSQSDGLAGPAFEVSAPIPLLSANGPERALRGAQVRRARLERDQARRSLRDDLELSLARLKTLEARIAEYESLRKNHPFASMTTALEATYTEGRSPAFEVLDGLFGLHESLAGHHQALLDREQLITHIGILVGGEKP